MTRPGVVVSSTSVPGTSTPGGQLGTWFVAGQTELGPTTVDVTKPILSLTDFVAQFGTRVSYGTLYDAVDAFFRTGGSRVFVARVVGPSATSSSLTLNDRAGSPLATLVVKPKGPGSYGTRITVQIINGTASNTFQILVTFDGTLVEQTGDLSTPADAVAWSSAVSRYVTITDSGSATAAPSNNPAVLSATALSGGSDDRTNITDTEWAAALAKFTTQLGPGLVSQPTRVTSAAHLQTIAHGAAYNREALLDGAAGASQATLSSMASTLQAGTGSDEFGALFAPWLSVPGVTGGSATSTRLVPPCAIAAGLISRQVSNESANVPAAGGNGEASWVLDLGQTAFTDAERETLNTAGVCVFKRRFATSPVALYGYRTLDTTGGWRALNNQLLRLAITYEAQQIGEDFMFDAIDGRGQKIAEWVGALSGMLQEHYVDNELYGETPEEAWRVDAGTAVNTPTTLANGELNAVLSVRMSPFAELVQIKIVKYPITESLVA